MIIHQYDFELDKICSEVPESSKWPYYCDIYMTCSTRVVVYKVFGIGVRHKTTFDTRTNFIDQTSIIDLDLKHKLFTNLS